MSFLRRKEKNLIPPVEPPGAARNELLGSGSRGNSTSPRPPPSYRSTASTYVASRDGDPYNGYKAPSRTGSQTDVESSSRYTRSTPAGDSYSRGQGNVDRDRQELFAGYNPQKGGSGRFFDDAPAEPGENEDEEVEGIKQQIRYTKQESVNSTRNALRMAREAEETARNTVAKLGDQSEKLANTERHLDVSKGHTNRAQDKTDELKQLNRSIFRPVITFNKDAKRAAQEAKLQQRYEEEREEREKAMMDIRETQNRLGRAQTYGAQEEDEEGIGGGGVRSRFKTAEQQALRKEQRKRYQFEATESDDEMENELDDNLDEIADATKRLKALGMAMGQELDSQVGRIGRIEEKTVNLDNKVFSTTERLKRIK
ncbi:synaptosome-associated proteinsynaptosomal-associated protein 25 [Gloeophyllum trabeum ATCC 11539]|uniref:Synaptosome-associated proteinsynaptosomal-associated protein 25 n=1 Tax=Gloeophyllum trabeum (strain ATCC 11539 / FP-39264 / Madison 617) TaxID=670483 RepID=S7QMJ7_GLOTA|nr:synaptosome-associated proteinsynaptosomal-associated protein 25 [Gloeophyllum trabeum ATCC 11539]EPQ60791.1 synaptosome-associated proteinsynaptosomal-associated protein 25 [Gloeophyllum trabeum ATCC 11539]